MTVRARLRRTNRNASSRGAQRGSVPILAFVFVIVALILAFAIDVGYAFMQRRDLQRAADMAALAGAQTLPGCANATSYASVAQANVTSNMGSNATGLQVTTSCGIWTSPSASATGPGTFVATNAGNAASGNAVSVTLSLGVPSFFQLAGTRTITATAIARKAPAVVTFTVDSGLLALNTSNSVLSSILTPLGVNLQAYVASGQQLVGTTVTPSGLLQALGVPVTGDVSVASLSGLATIQNLTVGQLLSATRTAVATQSGALSASVSALDGLISVFGASNALNLPVKLFGTATSPGVFANLDLAGVSAANALTANVNVMDLISTAIIGGNGTNAISISLGPLGGGPNLTW
ncbi:pilus assembly protein TadG-related protein [Pandoraea soli]